MKKYKGNFTVEMSYIAPLCFLIVLLLIYTIFYFHDKAVIYGAAGEVVTARAQYEREEGREEIDAEAFFRERAERKLIFLKIFSVQSQVTKDEIFLTVEAGKGSMKVHVKSQAFVPRPEEKIRKKRKIEGGFLE